MPVAFSLPRPPFLMFTFFQRIILLFFGFSDEKKQSILFVDLD